MGNELWCLDGHESYMKRLYRKVSKTLFGSAGDMRGLNSMGEWWCLK